MKPYLKSQQDLGGPLMDILGALLGGGASAAQPQSYPSQQVPQSQPQQQGTVLGTLDESGYQPGSSSSQSSGSQQMPTQQSDGGLGDILGSILGGGSAQQMPTQQSSGGMGDILGSILGGAMGDGSAQQAPTQQSSGGMGDILGSILGGAMGGGSTQQMPTQRSQQRNVPAQSTQSSAGMGDVLGSILGGMLGGSSTGMGGRSSQSSADPIGSILSSVLSGGMSSGMGATSNNGMGGMLGGLLGAGAGAALLDLTPFGPIVTDLANKLGIPPAVAKTVVAFALMKLITGAVQGRASAQKAPAMSLGTDVSGLSARLGAGQGVDRRYLARSGMVDELVNQTGLDQRTATQSLLAAFNALGSQVPDDVQAQFQQQFAQ